MSAGRVESSEELKETTMALSAGRSSMIDVAGAPADESAVSVSGNRSTRVDTLARAVTPYGQPLPEEQLERLLKALALYTLHRLLGSVRRADYSGAA
jgi:hypothetical protein